MNTFFKILQLDKLRDLVINRVAGSYIRTLMAKLAGVLLTIGVHQATVDSFTEASIEIGLAVVTYILVQKWSLKDKKETIPVPKVIEPEDLR